MFTLTRMLNISNLDNAYGILTINILESDIFRLMEKETSEKTILIVNDSGLIMSAKDKNMLNRPLNQFVKEKFPSAREGRFDSSFNGEKC